MQPRDRLILALDLTDGDLALELADRVRESAGMVKVGMPLLLSAGVEIVDHLNREGHQVVLDLRLHELPERVEAAVRAASRRGARMITVQGLGGARMMRAAVHGLSDLTLIPGQPASQIIASTLPAHSDAEQLAELGFDDDPAALCSRLTELATRAGLDGALVPARWIAAVRQALGEGPLLLCPGIRAPGDDDAHGVSATQALRNGASHLVVGNPIRRAADPGSVARALLEEIADATA